MAQYEIKINLPNLLKILSKELYTESDVAVRELIQNANDTCIIRQTKDRKYTHPRIDVSYNFARRMLTFTDNGAGMTETEIHDNLSTIGNSLTGQERERLREANREEARLLIGQFGIGLLSAYAVADKVEIVTKSYQPGSSGLQWTCKGDKYYSVDPINVSAIGTQVILYISDSKLELLDETRLQQAIKKYADFLSVPIYLNGKQVNSCTPPWLKKSSQAEYAAYIQTRYNLQPIVSFPFHEQGPLYLDGLLFVPLPVAGVIRDFGELDIYSTRMLIKANDKELLPMWARFIKGIINSDALTLPVGRDDFLRDEHYEGIRQLLGDIILQYLTSLEKQHPDILDMIVGTYNNTIKARALEEDEFFDRICELVRVNTDDGWLPMRAYLQQTQGGIYYFAECGMATQHKLLFKQKGFYVIDASWGVEETFLKKYAERKGVRCEQMEAGSSVLFTPPANSDDNWQELERAFQRIVHKEAKAMAFEPDDIPMLIVTKTKPPEDRAGLRMNSADVRNMFQRNQAEKEARAAGDDKIVHLNTTNPLVQQLRAMPRNAHFELALTALYQNAILAGTYVPPETMTNIVATNTAVIAILLEKLSTLDKVQAENARMEIKLNELKRKLQRLEERRVSVELRRKIVDFLTNLPNIDTITMRRTLILQAGLDEQLQTQLVFDGQAAQFVPILVETLIKYGHLNDGRHALEAVLQVAQEFVGQDKRRYCEMLIQELQRL